MDSIWHLSSKSYNEISMVNKTSSKILDRLEVLEKDLQNLKIETYFSLPAKIQKSLYPEKSLRRAIRSLRKVIWQERYAKKI